MIPPAYPSNAKYSGSHEFWTPPRKLSDGSEVMEAPTTTKQVIKRFFSGPHPLRNLGMPSRTASPSPSGSMSEKKEKKQKPRRHCQPYGRC